MAENRCFMLTLQTLLRKSNCRTKRYENNNISLFGLRIWVLWNWHVLFIYMNNMNVSCLCNSSWISWILHYKLSLNIFWICVNWYLVLSILTLGQMSLNSIWYRIQLGCIQFKNIMFETSFVCIDSNLQAAALAIKRNRARVYYLNIGSRNENLLRRESILSGCRNYGRLTFILF